MVERRNNPEVNFSILYYVKYIQCKFEKKKPILYYCNKNLIYDKVF